MARDRSLRARGRRSAPGRRERASVEEVATVRIEAIAAGGAGVGRVDGLTCFVPRTAPGDLAQVAYVNHGRYARGRLLQLLEPSTDRVAPRCVHYDGDECGGCQLQHLTSEAQRAARQQIVQDALRRVGHREVPRPEIVTGPEWAYRERLTLTLRARGSTWEGGLVPLTRAGQVFPLDECPIAHPQLVATWQALRAHLRGLPAVSRQTGGLPAAPMRLSLRRVADDASDSSVSESSVSESSVAVIVSGGRSWPGAADWAAQVHRAVPQLYAVWWEPEEGTPVHLAGHAASDALAFAQVNPVMAAALRAHVFETVQQWTPRHVVDAYSGRGELAVSLARAGAGVVAIEADAAATARASARLQDLPGTRVITALVEDALPDALGLHDAAAPRPDVVVLNPPRRGVDDRVTALLADSMTRGVRAIVYVSCDPATLARDCARLPRWRVASLRCFDMFPQTAHVETVCLLVPEES